MKALTPRAPAVSRSVRAKKRNVPACSAVEMNCFVPETRQPSPSGVAAARNEPASDPDSASVSAKSTAGDDTRGAGRLRGGQVAPDLAQLGLDADEGLDDHRIELPARLPQDLAPGRLPAHRPPVWPVTRHRVERIGHGEDSRA